MIDYEKLKLAENICLNHNLYWFNVRMGGEGHDYNFELFKLHEQVDVFEDIDSLLLELKELTEPEPKYKVGDEVWMAYDEPLMFIVTNNVNSKYYLKNHQGTPWIGLVYESELYPSKESLIEAQIDYWNRMYIEWAIDDLDDKCRKSEEKSTDSEDMSMLSTQRAFNAPKCEHKSNGEVYPIKGFNGLALLFKCLKCGEFYR